MTGLTPRAITVAGLVLVALVVQVSVLPLVAWHGIVPNLVLLVVVAAGLAVGTEFAMVAGFAAGLLLDLAPPADHVAGRWALALVVVGWLAGQARGSTRSGPWAAAGVVLACSFVGTSLFALSGVLLRDPAVGVGELLGAVLLAVLGDLLLAALVLPLAGRALRPAEPDGLLR